MISPATANCNAYVGANHTSLPWQRPHSALPWWGWPTTSPLFVFLHNYTGLFIGLWELFEVAPLYMAWLFGQTSGPPRPYSMTWKKNRSRNQLTQVWVEFVRVLVRHWEQDAMKVLFTEMRQDSRDSSRHSLSKFSPLSTSKWTPQLLRYSFHTNTITMN